jgi:low affinity Fe/Cu permease
MKTQAQKLKKHEESKDFFGTVSDGFRLAARQTSVVLGSAWAFAVAVLIILIWIGTGPTFHYSDT